MARFVDRERLRLIAERGGTVILLAAACALLFVPGLVRTVSGVRESPRLSAPDDLPQLASGDASPFFQSRNEVEIRVARATTLREFLDRNRLNKPHHRNQIIAQLGSGSPDAPIAADTVFRITLTPVAADVPGARTDAHAGAPE